MLGVHEETFLSPPPTYWSIKYWLHGIKSNLIHDSTHRSKKHRISIPNMIIQLSPITFKTAVKFLFMVRPISYNLIAPTWFLAVG
jgi:hypothetical protein